MASFLLNERIPSQIQPPSPNKQGAQDMHYRKEQIDSIKIPSQLLGEMISHCHRKLQGEYLPGEGQSPKAFGLIGGTVNGTSVEAEIIIPLFKNARECDEKRGEMDKAMNLHGTPSVTPFDQRGWIAEQEELDNALQILLEKRLRLVGNYHMHRIAWDHDPHRDTPTKIDTVLGCTSRMFMFIISMVNPEAPVIRAFFEGNNDFEVPVEII